MHRQSTGDFNGAILPRRALHSCFQDQLTGLPDLIRIGNTVTATVVFKIVCRSQERCQVTLIIIVYNTTFANMHNITTSREETLNNQRA